MKVWQRSIWFGLATVSLLLSIAISVFIFRENLLSRTLSSIGNANRRWFLSWSLIFSATCIINLKLLCIKLSIKGKLSVVFDILLFLSLPLAVVQAVIIDYSVNTAHIILAAVFSGYGLSLIVIFLVALTLIKTRRNKKLYKRAIVLLIFLCLTGISNLIAVALYGQLIAAYQLALIYVCLIVVYLMQLTCKEIPKPVP